MPTSFTSRFKFNWAGSGHSSTPTLIPTLPFSDGLDYKSNKLNQFGPIKPFVPLDIGEVILVQTRKKSISGVKLRNKKLRGHNVP